MRLPLVVAALVVGAAVVISAALHSPGDGPAHAWVYGMDYTLTGASALRATAADLTRYGPIDRSDEESVFAEQVAYALRGVDPHIALVVPVKRGSDVGESGTGYILLIGTGPLVPALCPYFVPGAPGSPAECE